MKRVIFIAVEAPWPPNQGGRVRMSGLIEGLRDRHDVTVVTWNTGHVETSPVRLHSFDVTPPRTRLTGFASRHPRIVRQITGATAGRDLARFAAHGAFDVAFYSHSYLAAALPLRCVPTIVDFPNVEARRYLSFARTRRGRHRLSAAVEHCKALRWEPRVARDADLATVLSAPDLEWVQQHTRHAITVPNGTDVPCQTAAPSPADGPTLYFGSMDYEPNRAAAMHLVHETWPLVRARLSRAELVIAGRGSSDWFASDPEQGITVLGEVSNIEATYRSAALVLAPVTSGAGRQLKVVEALTHCRTIVCTPYSEASVPVDLLPYVVTATTPSDFAKATCTLLSDAAARWRLEEGIRSCASALPSWHRVVEPVSHWIEEHAP